MRIGLDASLLGRGGGSAVYAEHLLPELARLAPEHALVLWCARRAAAPAARRLRLPRALVVAPGPLGRFLDKLGRTTWGNPLSIETLAGPLDLFHGLNYFLPAQRGKAALVVTVHDLSALRRSEWHPPARALAYQIALRRTARTVEHIITDSEAIRAELLEALGIPPGQVTAVPLAASPGFWPRGPAELKPALDRWDLSPGGYLLFAGAIEPRKNVLRLLEALALLRARRRPAPPLILAGPPGWRNRKARQAITASGPQARYLGFLDRDDLAALMAGCAAFVLPSLYEGFGLPILEAMASGVPVVTSRGGALEEVAGDAAILVDPLDVEAIAAGIERALDDTSLRETLVQKGLARAAQFSWERTAKATLRVYEQAIAGRR
jgi:alpha-1,3-rhamnosyl/mannosyltransferase